MYKVKVTTESGAEARKMFRQLPGGNNISLCKKYQFFINEDIKDPDFWVVRNKYQKRKETLYIAPENTILMISEPRSVVNFPKKYRNQFGVLYTCQEGVKHKNVFYGPAVIPWHVGIIKKNGRDEVIKTYDDLKGAPAPEKTKLISVITSDKAFTRGHWDRINFVEKLKRHYGDKLDVYGRGFRDIDDKWEALAPYEYHIAIENSSSKYYWTEKLSDCFLTSTYPIYYGCKNTSDYFPERSYTAIDINNHDEAINVIDNVIAYNTFEKSKELIETSKNLVLDNYNVFTLIARCLDRLDPSLPKVSVTLRPSLTVLDWHNFYLYFIERNIFALKGFIKGRSKLLSPDGTR